MTFTDTMSIPGLETALVPGPVFFAMTMLGDPKAKGRHRSRIVYPRGKKPFIHNYPEPETEAYEGALAQYARLKMRSRAPSLEPLTVLIIADIRVPKSWPERDRVAALEGRILPTSRPDYDNYGKIIDALNEIVWKDDSQVVDGRTIKRYSRSPALTIEVREFIAP